MRMLDKEELTLRWGELAPRVDEALSHGLGECSSFDMYLTCLAGEGQFWEHEGIIGITRFNRFPQYTQLQIVVTEGSWLNDDGLNLIHEIEKFAKEAGCKNISVWGRKGWRRMLTEYKEPYTVLIKELGDSNENIN